MPPFFALFSLFWHFSHQSRLAGPSIVARGSSQLSLLWVPLTTKWAPFPLCLANLLFLCHIEQRPDRLLHTKHERLMWAAYLSKVTREWHSKWEILGPLETYLRVSFKSQHTVNQVYNCQSAPLLGTEKHKSLLICHSCAMFDIFDLKWITPMHNHGLTHLKHVLYKYKSVRNISHSFTVIHHVPGSSRHDHI